jgi:hypothetical protein
MKIIKNSKLLRRIPILLSIFIKAFIRLFHTFYNVLALSVIIQKKTGWKSIKYYSNLGVFEEPPEQEQ